MGVRLTATIAIAAVLTAAGAARMTTLAAPAATLDFEFFRTRVQPVFLEKRPTHTRCYVCHAESNNAFRLEKLPAGASAWTDEQSRKNFEMASRLVVPGEPDSSRLLMQPLAPEGGGNVYHSGGRQFDTKDDPGWKTIAAWVSGAK